jgi:DNA-directed RNA polymerase subunit RPC12/RpoP
MTTKKDDNGNDSVFRSCPYPCPSCGSSDTFVTAAAHCDGLMSSWNEFDVRCKTCSFCFLVKGKVTRYSH